jgi:hypothetical protein
MQGDLPHPVPIGGGGDAAVIGGQPRAVDYAKSLWVVCLRATLELAIL